jgi:antitoxin StbD
VLEPGGDSAYVLGVTFGVASVREARSALSSVLSRFRVEGVVAAPVVVGRRGEAEGVLVPFALFERLLPAVEEVVLVEAVRARLAERAASVDFDEFAARYGLDVANYVASAS